MADQGSKCAIRPLGRPTTAIEPSGPISYEYDNRDRLAKACYATSCTGASDYIHYGYDAVANRISETRPSGTTNYSYDNDDRLLGATSATGLTSYAYDNNGNQVTAGANVYGYDAANRMKTATAAATTTTYAYDGDGTRLAKSSGPAPAQVTNFDWDTNAELPELAIERDGAGAVLRRYTYGQGPVAMTSAGADHTYQHDRLGSITAMSANLGQIEATYAYEPFGANRTPLAGPTNPMGFTGQYTDAETGLLHLRARQYDKTTGRFLTRDPVMGGSCNDYDYVCADPINGLDLTGECIQVWQQRCRGEGSVWAKAARLGTRAAKCAPFGPLMGACTASYYGALTVNACAGPACVTFGFSQAGGRRSVGLGGSWSVSNIFKRSTGVNVLFNTTAGKAPASGLGASLGACYKFCGGLSNDGVTGSRSLSLGIGTPSWWAGGAGVNWWDRGESE